MDKQTPSRGRPVKKEPLPPVSNPIPVEDREELTENKYARRTSLIAKPTLGRAVTVERVGLGNLKVITAHGVQPNV